MISRKMIFTIATLAATLSLHQPAQAADNYTIDPTHTSIIFSVGHAGLSYTYGMFRTAAGNYSIDKANPANSQFRIVIQAESLFTNDAKRDTHLRGPDFFNVEQFPTIEFQSTACKVSITPEGHVQYLLTGNFTMHGVTRQIDVPLRMLAEGLGPYKDQRTGFLCQLELKRSDFGLKKWLENNLVGDAVSVTISFEGYVKGARNLQSSTR
ncbi:MAG: YceI family protein [Planctomycetes bacterium]|nr:YceI family protein [Planctomycetota bacterium]